FGSDGRATRIEYFDAAHDAAALARFDELAAKPVPRPTRRRVRANRATGAVDRLEAALAARDVPAVASLHAEDWRAVHRGIGRTLDRQGVLDWWGAYLGDHDVSFHAERLVTLGDPLALIRLSWTGSAPNEPLLDVGGFAGEELDLVQTDAEGRAERIETFGVDHLADAVARLYELYADSLPDGPPRARAVATARSLAAMLTAPLDVDLWAGALAPDIESVDHRTLGTWSAHGADEMLQHLRSLRDLSHDVAARIDDILALRPEASLVRRTAFGTDRGGGAYERPYIVLDVFGSDGLLVRMDLFDVDREAEAPARFAELVTRPQAAPSENAATRLLVAGGLITRMEVFEPEDVDAALARFAELRPDPLRIPPNAATRAADRYVEALVARDWEAVEATCAPSLVFEDRRRLVRITGDRDMFIANSKLLGAAEQRVARTVLATAGERVALRRHHRATHGGLLAVGQDGAARARAQ